MSKDTTVAKRYAKALFEVAQSRGIVEQVEQDLQAAVDAVEASDDLRTLLLHPNIDTEAKVGMIRTVFEGKVADPVLQTLVLMIQRRRETLLSVLLDDYRRIANEALGRADAIVKTPFPLTEEQKAEIAESFGKLLGKTVRITHVLDKSLLGGMQVIIGDRLYDGSLAGKLDRLEKSLNVS